VSPNATKGRRGLAKVMRDIFPKNLNYTILACFFKGKSFFLIIKMERHTTGGGESVLFE